MRLRMDLHVKELLAPWELINLGGAVPPRDSQAPFAGASKTQMSKHQNYRK